MAFFWWGEGESDIGILSEDACSLGRCCRMGRPCPLSGVRRSVQGILFRYWLSLLISEIYGKSSRKC
jgi:hypothetical protein